MPFTVLFSFAVRFIFFRMVIFLLEVIVSPIIVLDCLSYIVCTEYDNFSMNISGEFFVTILLLYIVFYILPKFFLCWVNHFSVNFVFENILILVIKVEF